ncbi:glyoxalase [Mycobacterium sp. 852002-51163_SCH5372311]|uniref:glyoxalase n=1 Tax=Mycobacterium sp. 852002-51163_SCH5372311 TaxID=1834097 RepID=UPI0007FF15C2|nr:glyoxalase [Mycobacterium sp. 852002-51163_SCH5372311]OBF86135.1 glyoxalase [Mycobacterium sp. 852002-51163_SCH5372311]
MTNTSEQLPEPSPSSAVSKGGGPQFASIHVYVQPRQADPFINSWIATFGGRVNPMGIVTVTPTPSLINSEVILSPVGTLSVFEFIGPMPYPFGNERVGWRVADLDAAVHEARTNGAAILVAPFGDPVGRHAIVQLPGAITVQLYRVGLPLPWGPLETIPDSRIYLSPDTVDAFLHAYLPITAGQVAADDAEADGAAIGKPGSIFRQIRITSPIGNTVVLVTDGHLPYPFGREIAGYSVADLNATLVKAKSAGVAVLAAPIRVGGTHSAVLQFPGGYIAEVHASDAADNGP